MTSFSIRIFRTPLPEHPGVSHSLASAEPASTPTLGFRVRQYRGTDVSVTRVRATRNLCLSAIAQKSTMAEDLSKFLPGDSGMPQLPK